MLDVELVAAVADLAASAIASERLLLFTRTEARRDALTGLPNRRAFDERLDMLLARARRRSVSRCSISTTSRTRTTVSATPVGDDVLCAFARVTQRTLRATEELYRFGGDEFALLLRERRDGRARRRARASRAASAPAASTAADDLGRHRIRAGRRSLESGSACPRRPRALCGQTGRQGPDTSVTARGRCRHVLVVDDDRGLRELLRTTLEAIELDVEEADTAGHARAVIAVAPPDLILLDVGLPDLDGLTFCHELKADPRTRNVPVVILTGADIGTSERRTPRAQTASCASRSARSSCSPRRAAARPARPRAGDRATSRRPAAAGAALRADLRHLLELERGQRALLQHAYRQTVGALAARSSPRTSEPARTRSACFATRPSSRAPSTRAPRRAERRVRLPPARHRQDRNPRRHPPQARTADNGERSVLQTHTVLGEQMLAGVPLLAGTGLRIVRSHHERWDGTAIPIGWWVMRFRSVRVCSRSRTRSTR